MVEPLRHRQTKEAATDMLDLKSPRHTSTLPFASLRRAAKLRRMSAMPSMATESVVAMNRHHVPLADIGTTAVIGHPVVMSLRWRSGSTLDLVAAYSLGRNFV